MTKQWTIPDRRTAIPGYDQRVGSADFETFATDYRNGWQARGRMRCTDPMAKGSGSDQ
ncbi:hypothetical protein GCM10020229_35380 [Kitasatospora albolonga]|uniref:hypothetical protein n=1 Tax=Kitasatospora albolonga TaxID=68173 RepID=UPI0031ECEB54